MTQHPPTPVGPLVGADAALHYVQRRTQDGIAILTMAAPDGNRLAPELVSALARAVALAQQDPGVRGLVLTARGSDFCAGPWTDLPPPGPDTPKMPAVIADLADLCDDIARAAKPVVCAVHGRVTAGGLALALAAQGIIADARASLHFPEPKLGRLPAGNGIIRLCWRLGAEDALRFLRQRNPTFAPEALSLGLVDRVVSDALMPAAILFASSLAQGSHAVAVPGLADSIAYRDAVGVARARLQSPVPVNRNYEQALVDCVEAAQLLPPAQALAFDLVHAQDAALAPVARALAHLSRATRRALKTPESLAAAGAPLRQGTIAAALSPENAARLVPALLRSGVEVVLMAPDRDPLAQTLEAVAEAQLDLVAAGRMTQAQSEADWHRIAGRMAVDPSDPPALAFADLEHAAWLEGAMPAPPPLVLWSPGRQALPQLAQPTFAVGLVPAPSRAPRVCEVVVQPGTDTDSVRYAVQLALRLKLTPVRTLGDPAIAVLSHAAAAAAVRLRALGVNSARLRATGLLHNGAELGEAAADITPLPHTEDRLIVLAVVNAAARLLRQGTSLRPSDLDLAMVLGAGWPNWRGGPLAEADAIGPMVLRHELTQASDLDPDLWTPDALFDDMIRQSQTFEGLNAD